jgi:hypothetical protein
MKIKIKKITNSFFHNLKVFQTKRRIVKSHIFTNSQMDEIELSECKEESISVFKDFKYIKNITFSSGIAAIISLTLGYGTPFPGVTLEQRNTVVPTFALETFKNAVLFNLAMYILVFAQSIYLKNEIKYKLITSLINDERTITLNSKDIQIVEE